ncbi:MAG: BACON domain-containing carbohydrate-binding protein [Bryobacteraceae bacterium]
MAGSAPASGTQFTYNGFASTAGLTMVGNAATVSTSDGTVLRLTPATGNQSGAAYNTTPVTLGNNATFSTQFQFRFSNQGGTEPADGIVFVLGTSTKGLGGLGVGMGYQGVSGNSFGIEFDTYNNTGFGLGNDDGNSSNHVSIDTNGNLTNTDLTNVYGNQTCVFATGTNSNTAAGCMSNGDLWTVNISYNGSNLTVTLTDPAKGSSFTAINNYPINLASVLGQNTAYVGFTSGTGAGWENHDIVNWTFANTTQSAACTYSLSTSSASVGAAQTTGTVAVTAGTGCTWTATSNAPTWLTTSSAGIGSGSVSYAVTANAGTSSRSGTITVGGQTFTVTQAAAEIFTNFNSSACNQTGTSQFTLTNTANVTHWGVWYDWSTGQTSVAATVQQGSTTLFSGNLAQAACDLSQTSWCNADAVVNATWPAGAYTVTVSPARMCANSGSSNQGFVYIYGAWQAAGSCTYSLSPTSASPGAAQTNGTITVTAGSGCTWTAASNATSWLTITGGASGTGNGTVSYTVAANTSTSSRTGTITVGGQTFTVTQAGAAACSYLITPTSYNMAAQGGSSSITVTVTAGNSCSWAASVSSSAASWLHLGSTTSGTTNGSVSFTGDANTSMGSRTGTITVANQTFTVTQAGGATTSAPSISAGGIVNALDYRGGGIAQGAFFTIFGSNLGPAVGQGVTGFPFNTNLGGVTVTVTQGSITKQAYPHYVCATQINAIMPSDAPLGNVQITVAYNGVIGAAAAATVVNNAFGIMAVGSGPGIIQNYNSATDEPINAASKPAKPNQIEIIWGTGLGPISTPDNQPPPGGQLPLPVQVWVGGKQASVQYSGRAPGFPAIDNIYFTVPPDAPLGCYIPVQVNAGGTWSNTSRLAISSDGKPCQDTFNPYSGLSSNGGRSGTIGLVRVNFTDQLGQTSETSATVDLGLGAFATNAGSTTTYSPITNLPPPGTCVATNKMLDLSAVMNTGGSSLDPTITAALDAGPQLTVSKPGGASITITRDTEDEGPTAPYLKALGGVLTPAISDFDMGPLFLDGDPFTVSNGTGGKDVGPFTTTIPLAPAITWTNPPSTINRSAPLTLTWTGGNSTQTILILGGSSDQNSQASGGFTCLAPATAGTFTVPANALADMIPIGAQTDPASIFGMLSLMPLQSGNMQFTKLPTGLDVGVAFNTTMTVRTVQVK